MTCAEELRWNSRFNRTRRIKAMIHHSDLWTFHVPLMSISENRYRETMKNLQNTSHHYHQIFSRDQRSHGECWLQSSVFEDLSCLRWERTHLASIIPLVDKGINSRGVKEFCEDKLTQLGSMEKSIICMLHGPIVLFLCKGDKENCVGSALDPLGHFLVLPCIVCKVNRKLLQSNPGKTEKVKILHECR